jgi:hypothetical protein
VRRAFAVRRAAAALVPLPAAHTVPGGLVAILRSAGQLKDAIQVRLFAVPDAASSASGTSAAKIAAAVVAVAALGTTVAPHATPRARSPRVAPASAAKLTPGASDSPPVVHVRRAVAPAKRASKQKRTRHRSSRPSSPQPTTVAPTATATPLPMAAPDPKPSKRPGEEFPIF